MFQIIAEFTGYNVDILMFTAASIMLSLHFIVGRDLLKEED